MAGQWVQEVEMEAWPGQGSPSLEQNQVIQQIHLCMHIFLRIMQQLIWVLEVLKNKRAMSEKK